MGLYLWLVPTVKLERQIQPAKALHWQRGKPFQTLKNVNQITKTLRAKLPCGPGLSLYKQASVNLILETKVTQLISKVCLPKVCKFICGYIVNT